MVVVSRSDPLCGVEYNTDDIPSHGTTSVCNSLDERNIDDPYIMTLGPSETFFIAGKLGTEPVWRYCLPKGTRVRIQQWDLSKKRQSMREDDHSWDSSSTVGAPRLRAVHEGDGWNMLKGWIEERMTCDVDVLQCSTVTLGIGNTFYARTPESCLWNCLPDDLEQEIVKRMENGMDAPSRVCLGLDDTWVAFYSDGAVSWNLKSHYSAVHERLKSEKGTYERITALALSPYTEDYFLHHANGMCCWSVGLGDNVRNKFIQMCWTYMQERAREDESTFNLKNWNKNDSQDAFDFSITPATKWDSPHIYKVDSICGPLGVPHAWKLRLQAWLANNQSSLKPREGVIGLSIGGLLGIYFGRRGLFRRWRR